MALNSNGSIGSPLNGLHSAICTTRHTTQSQAWMVDLRLTIGQIPGCPGRQGTVLPRRPPSNAYTSLECEWQGVDTLIVADTNKCS